MSSSLIDDDKPPSKRLRSSFVRRDLQDFPKTQITPGPSSSECACWTSDARSAMQEGYSLVVSDSLTAASVRSLRDSWTSYVHQDQMQYQTVNLTAAKKTLREVWESSMRIEQGLKNDHDNPVMSWLKSPSADLLTRQMMDRLEQLKSLAYAHAHRVRVARKHVEFKSFIAGVDIMAGGGPCHFDEYDNFAMVLTGMKIFYHAPPEAFASVQRNEGEYNERLTVNPFDDVTLNRLRSGQPLGKLDTVDRNGSPLSDRWKMAVLRPGDILLLPHRWWHWVWSEPGTVMVNVWVPRSA